VRRLAAALVSNKLYREIEKQGAPACSEAEREMERPLRRALSVCAMLLLALWLSIGCAGESNRSSNEETAIASATTAPALTTSATTTPRTTSAEDPNPVRITGNLGDPRRTAPTFTISPDGKKVAFSTVSQPQIYVVGTDGTYLSNNPVTGGGPATWSPDGEKLAFTGMISGDPEIYTMDPDGSNLTNISRSRGHSNDPGTPFDGEPVFSPDGDKIAFTSQRDGDFEIYMMNSDGTGQTNLTNDPGFADTDPAFSKDGEEMAFRKCSIQDSTCHIHVMNSDGTNQTLAASNVGAVTPVLSPSGKKIAFRRADQSGKLKIFVMNVDGSNLSVLTDRLGRCVSNPVFLPDGRIAFVSNPADNDEVYTINQDGTQQTNITDDPRANDGAGDEAPSFSADGKKMAFLKAHFDDSGEYVSEIYLMDLDEGVDMDSSSTKK
jgi:Tol biopolymer transport system component